MDRQISQRGNNRYLRDTYLPEVPMGQPIQDHQDDGHCQSSYRGKLPIGSRRLQKRELRQRTLRYATKALLLGGAVGLIVISALRFTTINTGSIHQGIMNFYFLFMGLVLGLTQLGIKRVLDKFRLINYYWGRCVFSLFLASMSFSDKTEALVRYLVTIYFFVCAVGFFVLIFFDKEHDKEQAKKDAKIIETLGNANEGSDLEKLPFAKYFMNSNQMNKPQEQKQFQYGLEQETDEEQPEQAMPQGDLKAKYQLEKGSRPRFESKGKPKGHQQNASKNARTSNNRKDPYKEAIDSSF